MIEAPGGVPEWLNGAVSKTVDGGNVVREFESLPLRLDVAEAAALRRFLIGQDRSDAATAFTACSSLAPPDSRVAR
jgi:hypothetical protein